MGETNMGDAKLREAWEARSREGQAALLQRIAARLGRPTPTAPPPRPFRGAPEYWREVDLPPEERIERFMANWRAAGGHAFRFATLEEAGGFIRDFLRETGASRVVVHDRDALHRLGMDRAEPALDLTVWNTAARPAAELLADCAAADVGIAAADYAVAYTGTVVVRSGPAQGRSVSLLPKVFIAVVAARTVRMRLGEALAELDAERSGGKLPAGIHFISGPSRSADIENDLTIGVHGPGLVYALVVDAL
jgi:L-lactate dehydrogenase complex protein LldG